MSDQPHTFDPEGAGRIVKATRWAESQYAVDRDDSDGTLPRGRGEYWFELAASPVQDSSNYRWTYTGTAKIKTSAGFSGWVDDPRFSGAKTLFNATERSNGASGIVSGYDLSDEQIDGILPIGAGELVRAWPVRFLVSGTLTVEWWFRERNDPIIVCPEAP